MALHEITVDEDVCSETGLPIFRAYCTEECGWMSEAWIHACSFAERGDERPTDLAYQDASNDGARHRAEATS